MNMLRPIAGITACALALIPALAGAVGSTPVSIVNPADIAKAQGIQQPFQTQFNCSANGGFGIRCFGSATVPAGQRWVIEYASANCKVDNTHQVVSQAYVMAGLGPSTVLHFLAIPDHVGAVGDSGPGINIVQLGQPVRLYSDAGTISVAVETSGVSQFAGYPNCEVSLSGQAISVP